MNKSFPILGAILLAVAAPAQTQPSSPRGRPGGPGVKACAALHKWVKMKAGSRERTA